MLELFTKHGGFDLKLESHGRPGCRPASHRGRRRHRARPTSFEGAGRSQRHQSRRLLRHDRWMRRWRWSRSILSGRPALVYDDKVKVRLVGDLQTELVEDFFGGFVNHAGANSARQGDVRAIEPSQDRSHLQVLRARAALCVLERPSAEGPAAVDEGVCYDHDSRLRRRQSALRAKHAG